MMGLVCGSSCLFLDDLDACVCDRTVITDRWCKIRPYKRGPVGIY